MCRCVCADVYVREKERKKVWENVCITDDGQNRLSRKWNSFTGFSAFDRPFVYHSRWMTVRIWKDRLLRVQRSHIRVYVNSATSVAQLLSMKPWVSIFFFYSPKRIDRGLFQLVRMTSNSVQSAVPTSMLCMQRSLPSAPHWWFICRVNRKTKPFDSLTAEKTQMQSRTSENI